MRPALDGDLANVTVAVTAARALLRARTEEEVVAAVMDAVLALGASPVPPTGGPDQVPIDVTFGIGDPLVPSGSPEALRVIREVLPGITEDALVALDRTRRDAHLAETALTDALTGLANRRVAMRVLGRIGPGDVVVALDLDHFKAVNDTFGHEAGDAVLRAFARSMRSVCRATDLPGRIGGEEFVLVLPRSDIDGAVALLGRLGAHWAESRPREVTFSAGVAKADAHEDPGETLRRADSALYAAKHAGRNQVKIAP